MATTYAIPDGRVAMAATIWTGNGSNPRSIDNTVNGVSFQPDFVWAKLRSSAASHNLYDSVRGVGNVLYSDLTTSEANNNPFGYLTAFNSNGFSSTAGSTSNAYFNANGSTYVGWQWKAGGTAVSNTAGSITSSVSANPTAGFSVVTYTGTGANATVGHGLGVAPSMVIVKCRNSAGSDWLTWHIAIAGTDYLLLDTTAAKGTSASVWNSTVPTSSVFNVGTNADTNGSTRTFVAYCFAPVAGYSVFGSYTGNGSTDGSFIYTGMRPRWILVKRTDVAATWYIWNTSSTPYNVADTALFPNLTNAESSNVAYYCDILSNGFKIRATNTDVNASGGTYIYMAFAENPFKYANAR